MKQLFGEHGWLGKSMSMKELPTAEYRKGGIKHWGGKLKERVEHLVFSPSSPLNFSALKGGIDRRCLQIRPYHGLPSPLAI
jgi:hypothetical protein